MVSFAFGVLAGPEAEVESLLDQVGDVVGFVVGGRVFCGHDGLGNTKGVAFSRLTVGYLIL